MTAEYKVHGSVAVITLANPPVNGLGLSTRQGIVDGLDKAQQDAAREQERAANDAARAQEQAAQAAAQAVQELARAGQSIKDYVAKLPLKRPGTPADYAETIFYLLAGAPYITGQTIVMDGGGAR